MDSNDEDCGADAGSSSTAVIVDEGSNGMKLMELIGIDEGCGLRQRHHCHHSH